MTTAQTTGSTACASSKATRARSWPGRPRSTRIRSPSCSCSPPRSPSTADRKVSCRTTAPSSRPMPTRGCSASWASRSAISRRANPGKISRRLSLRCSCGSPTRSSNGREASRRFRSGTQHDATLGAPGARGRLTHASRCAWVGARGSGRYHGLASGAPTSAGRARRQRARLRQRATLLHLRRAQALPEARVGLALRRTPAYRAPGGAAGPLRLPVRPEGPPAARRRAPRTLSHRLRLAQLELWELDDEQWRKVTARPYERRPQPPDTGARQLALPAIGLLVFTRILVLA